MNRSQSADTGYADEPYYECSCGSRMGAEDYAQLCTAAVENAPADRKPVLPELPAGFKFIEVA